MKGQQMPDAYGATEQEIKSLEHPGDATACHIECADCTTEHCCIPCQTRELFKKRRQTRIHIDPQDPEWEQINENRS